MRPSRKSRPVPPPHSGPLAVAQAPEPRPLPPFQVLAAPPPPKPKPAVELTDDMIAARAHEIWQRRGCPMDGDGKQDWYAAVAELQAELAR